MKGMTALQNFTLVVGFIVAVALPPTEANQEPVCADNSSYYHGLELSDRIDNDHRQGLGTECRIVQYKKDNKPNQAAKLKSNASHEALGLFEW